MLAGTDSATAVRLYKALLQQATINLYRLPGSWKARDLHLVMGNPKNGHLETPYDFNSQGCALAGRASQQKSGRQAVY
jgi:hypothetical protein